LIAVDASKLPGYCACDVIVGGRLLGDGGEGDPVGVVRQVQEDHRPHQPPPANTRLCEYLHFFCSHGACTKFGPCTVFTMSPKRYFPIYILTRPFRIYFHLFSIYLPFNFHFPVLFPFLSYSFTFSPFSLPFFILSPYAKIYIPCRKVFSNIYTPVLL
jgi:hypothetical protein